MAKNKKTAKKAAKAKPAPRSKASAKRKKPVKAKPTKAAVKSGRARAVKAKPVKGAPKAPAKVAKPEKVIRSQPKAAKVEPVLKEPKGKKAPPPPIEVEVEEQAAEEVVLTDAEGRRYCRVKDCDQIATVDGYCRYHYLLYWKKIQIRKKILAEGKLDRYIEELTARYPDKFLDMLRKDLRSEKEFLAAIQELEIDESQVEGEFEDENENFIDEVRGMSEPAAREEEDF